MSKTTLSSFKQAVRALESADLILIQDKDSSDRVVATFVGWEDVDDDVDLPDFVIGAEGWDDVYIPHGQNITREGHVIKPHGACVVLELYKAMK